MWVSCWLRIYAIVSSLINLLKNVRRKYISKICIGNISDLFPVRAQCEKSIKTKSFSLLYDMTYFPSGRNGTKSFSSMYDVRLAKGRYWRWRSLMSEWYPDLVRDKNVSHSRFFFPQVLLLKGHTTPFYILIAPVD